MKEFDKFKHLLDEYCMLYNDVGGLMDEVRDCIKYTQKHFNNLQKTMSDLQKYINEYATCLDHDLKRVEDLLRK